MKPCPNPECSGGEVAFNKTFPRDPQRDEYARCPVCRGRDGIPVSEYEDAAWMELERRNAA